MRLKILLLAAAVVVTGTVYLLSGKTEPSKSQTGAADLHLARATKGTISKTLRLAGQTSARNFVNIVVPRMNGPESNKPLILMKLAAPGSHVRKGQLIAELDAQQYKDHVDDVADFVRQADADIRKRTSEQQIEWETLQQTLRQAKADMEKAKLDAKTTSLLTDIERELLELNAEETTARYQQLQKNLKFQKEEYDAEIKILQYTKERQTRHHDRHARDLKAFTIFAPIDGLAVMQQIWRGGDMAQVANGDQLSPGQLFMKVVNPASMQVEAKINQAESSDLRIGQPASVHLDAFPSAEFKGHVYSIGALASGGWIQNSYIRNIPVSILIDGSDPRIIPDLSASGDVVLGQAENVVRIPLAAVREVNGQATVMVRQGDSFQPRAVTLGLHNGEMAAVLSGVQAGDEVKLN